jgi:hypothetical protein
VAPGRYRPRQGRGVGRGLSAKQRQQAAASQGLTFGAYLANQWLPAKHLQLATSTYRGYERNVKLHVLPTRGRVALRRLSYQQIEGLYDRLLNPVSGRGLHPKTVYEIHLLIRGALTDAARGSSPATSPPSPGHPSSAACNASRTNRGPTPTYASSCAPRRGTGTSRSCG